MDLGRAARRFKFLRDVNHLQALALWSAALLVGLSAVAYAQLFKLAEKLFFSLVSHRPELSFVVTPVMFLIAWILVRLWAPDASGSGIPQIMAAAEMPYERESKAATDRMLSLRTGAVKVISSLCCVAGGGAIGREGPTLQLSACIFHFFGRWLNTIDRRIQVQTFIVAGAASGLASAFNTPLGGIVYAIEELGGHYFHRVRTALLSAVIISGLIAQWMIGTYLYLGEPLVPAAGVGFAPSAVLVGAISGLAGATFSHLLFRAVEVRRTFILKRSLALVAIVCGLGVATLFYFDQRNAGSGLDVIMSFLFKQEPSQTSLVFSRWLATSLSYLSGAAGGIFSPSLTIGATIGAELADFVGSSNHNLMVLLGMIGFLTGVTRTPFTAFILVIEMSDRHSAVLPMMLAALVSQLVASLISPHSFYEEVKARYLVAKSDS